MFRYIMVRTSYI